MKFTTSEQGNVTIITLAGNLMGGPDGATLKNTLHELLAAGKKNVVVDLKEVEFMNSSGLGLLLGGLSTVKNAGGLLKLANASEKIASLIKISKLASVFEMLDSVQGAVESFKK